MLINDKWNACLPSFLRFSRIRCDEMTLKLLKFQLSFLLTNFLHFASNPYPA